MTLGLPLQFLSLVAEDHRLDATEGEALWISHALSSSFIVRKKVQNMRGD